MSHPSSVLEKARTMTAEADRIRKGAEAEHDALRVSQRVDETRVLLQELKKLAGAARRLNAVSGAQLVDLSGLDDGRTAFGRHVANGLPSNQVFSAAKQKIKNVAARLSTDLTAAWSQWTRECTASLPLARIGLLPAEEQQEARSDADELASLARKNMPTSTDVGMFAAAAARLREALSEVPDPPPEVLPLLERLSGRPAPSLAEVTDEEIALLRQTGVAAQIEMRRRGQ